MTKPVKQRVKDWRKKKTKKGGRSLSTWLEPETAKMMDYLRDHYGEKLSEVIARAIKTLYEVTSNDTAFSNPQQTDDQPMETPHDEQQEPAQGREDEKAVKKTHVTSDETEEEAILEEIKEELTRGASIHDVKKTLLLAWIKTMKDQGVSFDTMAEKLNSAHIPTLTGMGQWERGTVATFLILNL